MSLLGKQIKLTGKTQKGKNRVREHGNEWVVLAETQTILFSPSKQGPWLFVAPQRSTYPQNQGHDDKASRWVHLNNDENFVVQV